jgi:hypothetical protein
VLSVLAGEEDYLDVTVRWFDLGITRLMPAEKVPPPRWAVQPCHAVLHRTVEYADADYDFFEKYPFPLSHQARTLDGSKIGGGWGPRGYLPDPAEEDDPKIRKELEREIQKEKEHYETFICQLGSHMLSDAYPFLNIKTSKSLTEAQQAAKLMIQDVGGLDVFYNGSETELELWCG